MFSSLPMFRLLVAAVCFLLHLSGSSAQQTTNSEPNIKFGEISTDQFSPSGSDSTNEAIVLYNLGEVKFEFIGSELWMNFTHHVRTRIQKKSAYDRATIEIGTRRGKAGQHEYVWGFESYTYNLSNGQITKDKLGKANQVTERVADTYWVEKYTLPNVREGSVIEYRYTVRTPFSVGYNPRTWYYQQDVPVRWSEYRITIPDYFYYKMMQSGYLTLVKNQNRTTSLSLLPGENPVSAVAYQFAVKDAPAFRNEAYITTEDDYLSKIDFELASYQLPGLGTKDYSVSWETLDRTLLTDVDFGGQINRAGFLRETAKELLSKHRDTLDRITAAYDFVRQNIKWDEEEFLWSVKGIKKVFENKKGNAADINLMLIALLREMDIETNPVILSTRSHGRVNVNYPIMNKFNYVVAHTLVGGKDLLLDATDTYLAPGMLPLRCLNESGRLVHPTKSRFISLVPGQRDIESQVATFIVNEDGDISGTLSHSHGGYSALSNRKEFTTNGQAKYLDEIRKKRTTWQIEQASFSGTDAKAGSFTIDYKLAIPEACSKAGDRLYFLPMLTEAHLENPFKETERLYPVDFGVLIDDTFRATYTIPTGYQVEEMPKAASVALPENGGRFLYQIALGDNNTIQVISRIVLRKTRYFADEYFALRELFSQIVAKHAEQVVLKRETMAEKK